MAAIKEDNFFCLAGILFRIGGKITSNRICNERRMNQAWMNDCCLAQDLSHCYMWTFEYLYKKINVIKEFY